MYYKPLTPEPDSEDLELHAARCDLDLLTRRCRELAPVIGFVGGRVTAAGEFGADGEIPLLEGPMNQNAIQLASNHYLLADWIVAVATFCALPGTSAVGFHDPHRSTPVQIWTLGAEITHLAAGTGTIHVSCRPAKEEVARIRRELIAHGQARFEASVDLFQGKRPVSRVRLKQVVFASVPREKGAETTMVQAHAHKVSALLVAGLRDDPWSQMLAGQQGRALANRMLQVAPMLKTLIKARTEQLDELILRDSSKIAQILLVGTGLDCRPLRLETDASWFGVDLEPGLKNRLQRYEKNSLTDAVRTIAADLRTVGWLEQLVGRGFDPQKATLVVIEGVSMYLEPADLRGLLFQLGGTLRSPDSRIWLDHVTPRILASKEPYAAEFFSTMARMGEPFRSGFADLESVMPDSWTVASCSSAADWLDLQDDEVHAEYKFTLLRAKT
jgi:methyltransferase (TIGR00027 family)